MTRCSQHELQHMYMQDTCSAVYIYHISVNSTLYDVVRVASSVWFANARRLKGKC